MYFPLRSRYPPPVPPLSLEALTSEPGDAAAAARRRVAAVLRDSARFLRAEAVALADVVGVLRAYDRPDVWQGSMADRVRHERDDITRRLTSPSVGAATMLSEAAHRMEARADALESGAADSASW